MLIGFLSDAHGNLQGFQKGLDILKNHGADEIYFLGDAIGYIPRTGVVRKLRQSSITCIMGNHEAMLLKGQTEPEKDSVYKLSQVARELTSEEKEYLESWPEKLRLSCNNQRLLLIHGSPIDYIFGYVYPDTNLDLFSSVDEDVILMGNTHHAFIRTYKSKLFINVGSCGLPRDSEGTGCVCLYDCDSNEAQLIRYDLSESAGELLGDPAIHYSVKRHLQRSVEVSLK